MRKNYSLYAFLLLVLLNKWIWLIRKNNIVVLFLVLLSSLFVYKAYFNNSLRKLLIVISALLYILLTFTFVKTTETSPLNSLSALEKDTQQKRLRSYPSPPIPLIPGTIAYEMPDWFEKHDISISIYRIKSNLTNYFDPNYYFFGSFPREMQIPGEFSKFPFFYLIFFVMGLIEIIKNKRNHLLIIYVLISLITVAYLGDRNHLGLYINFPLLVVTITVGATKFAQLLESKKHGEKVF